MKRRILNYSIILLLTVFTLGAAYAAFSDKGKYTGSTFNVASADLKILNDLSLGIVEGNLVDEKQGPVFNNVEQNWHEDYPIKLYNNATTNLNLMSNSYYETANDPEELRQIIYCEIYEWNDADADGVIDEGEMGNSLGMKTLIKWKTEGIPLGVIPLGEAKGYILRFSTTSTFPDSKQGKSGTFDFEFSTVGQQ